MNSIVFASLLIISLSSVVQSESNADVLNLKVDRTIDLTTHLTKIIHSITVENQGNAPLKSYVFTVEPQNKDNVAYIGAQTSESREDNKNGLKVTQVNEASNKGLFYRIDLNKELAKGKSATIEVELVLFDNIKPYPNEITQNEKQLVLYKGNLYYYSQYQTKSQQTRVNLASDKVESYTQVKPTSKSDQTITYGSYENIKPFEQSELSIHYENNTPFLRIKSMTRVIEVSNWGNIAVEETIDMYHAGAALKGPFSRFDYMRKQGAASSVKSFMTILPPTARDIYYRDEIGNISTSNVRETREQVEVELRPRFPLFGGWRTHYTIGYNVPTYQYLFNKGNNYALKMKFIDHIYDDQLIEHLTVKIILPEFSTNIDFLPPYSVQRGKNDLHFTYLDTVGRPVIIAHKHNAVDNHIQDFELRYSFARLMILQEPLLLVGAFFALFLVILILVRIDFSISDKSNVAVKEKEN